MNILGCLDSPTTGRYVLAGDRRRHARGAPSRRGCADRTIGFVFQSFNLVPRTTATANVELPLMYAGRAAAGAAARGRWRRWTRSGWRDRAHHTPDPAVRRPAAAGRRGPGHRRRAGAACSPTSRPATWTRAPPHDVLRVLADLHDAGRTVVVITHEHDVAGWAGRTVVMHDGRVASDRRQVPAPPAAYEPPATGAAGAAGEPGDPRHRGPGRGRRAGQQGPLAADGGEHRHRRLRRHHAHGGGGGRRPGRAGPARGPGVPPAASACCPAGTAARSSGPSRWRGAIPGEGADDDGPDAFDAFDPMATAYAPPAPLPLIRRGRRPAGARARARRTSAAAAGYHQTYGAMTTADGGVHRPRAGRHVGGLPRRRRRPPAGGRLAHRRPTSADRARVVVLSETAAAAPGRRHGLGGAAARAPRSSWSAPPRTC